MVDEGIVIIGEGEVRKYQVGLGLVFDQIRSKHFFSFWKYLSTHKVWSHWKETEASVRVFVNSLLLYTYMLNIREIVDHYVVFQ